MDEVIGDPEEKSTTKSFLDGRGVWKVLSTCPPMVIGDGLNSSEK